MEPSKAERFRAIARETRALAEHATGAHRDKLLEIAQNLDDLADQEEQTNRPP